MPTATQAAPGLDIGEIMSGMASIFGAMPQQIGPAQFIPQVIPQIIPQLGRGEQGPSEWDIFNMFQDFTEGWDFGLTEEGAESIFQKLIDRLPFGEGDRGNGGNGGNGGGDKPPLVTIIEVITGKEDLGLTEVVEAGTGVVETINKNTADYLTNLKGGLEWGYEAIFQGGLFRVGGENSLAKLWPGLTPLTPEQEAAIEFRASIFEEVGVTSAEFGAMSTAQRDALFAGNEIKAAEKYPGYTADMELLAESTPSLLSEAELERYS